jgi:hypothetical protein
MDRYQNQNKKGEEGLISLIFVLPSLVLHLEKSKIRERKARYRGMGEEEREGVRGTKMSSNTKNRSI